MLDCRSPNKKRHKTKTRIFYDSYHMAFMSIQGRKLLPLSRPRFVLIKKLGACTLATNQVMPVCVSRTFLNLLAINNNEILIKCEPLAYTRARRAVQRKKKKMARTVQQQ